MSDKLNQLVRKHYPALQLHYGKEGRSAPDVLAMVREGDKRGLLSLRNQLRREMNDAASTLTGEKRSEAIGTLANLISVMQEGLDALDQLHDSTPIGTGGKRKRASTDWTTRDGKPVVALNASIMRDRDALRSALAPLGPRFEDRGGDDDELTCADFLRGIAGMKCSDVTKRALASGTGAGGGFVVPGIVLADILEALAPASTLLSAGTQVLMLDELSNQFRWAAVNVLPTPAWRNEGAAVAESDPAFRNIDFVPRSLSVLFRVSRELLMDSPVLQQAIPRIIAQAFAAELDRVGLRGTGTAPQPRGILNTVGIQAVTNGANGSSLGTTAYANLITGMQSIRTANGPMPTAAIMAPRSLATLAGLLDTTNQPRQVPPLLSTWQMLDTSAIPTNLVVGTSNDCSEIYVGNFATTAFGMRQDVQIQQLNERYADTGEVGFVAHVRVDFAALYPAALAVATGVRA